MNHEDEAGLNRVDNGMEAGSDSRLSRRKLLLGSSMLAATPALSSLIGSNPAQAQTVSGRRPNILVIWGDDIGWQNVSAYGMGTMGYRTPISIGLARKGSSLLTTTRNLPALQDARPSLPVSIRSAQA